MGTKNKGFTILELVIIVAILSVLMAFAGPSLSTMIANNRISGGVNDFVAAMQFAKTEAAARISPVTICKKKDNSSDCDGGGDWQRGWIVFVDVNSDADVDSDDQILMNHEALDSRITFGGTAQVQDAITFQSSGTTSVTSAQVLIMCDERGFIDAARGVLVTITGRGSVLKASDTGQAACL